MGLKTSISYVYNFYAFTNLLDYHCYQNLLNLSSHHYILITVMICICEQLTWADIAYYSFFTTPVMVRVGGDERFNGAPELKRLIELVGNVPGIKKYVETRPVTTM